MPVILKNSNPGGLSTGLWEITETQAELLKLAGLNPEEKGALGEFKNEGRRKQWLAVRVLLGQFINPRPVILYKQNGKPYLKDNSTGISISHSGKMAAIALHANALPGIDVEAIHPKINKIANRFVSDAEMAFLNQDTLTEQLCILWAAKEVLYKINSEGMLSFKENLSISPFTFTNDIHGASALLGTIKKDNVIKTYKLEYQKTGDYVLVQSL